MKKLFLTTLVIIFVAVLGLQSVAFAQQAGFEPPALGETDEALASAQAAVGSISGLKIINTSHNSVKLTWKKATNTYKYQIYRSLTKSGGYKLVRQQRTLTYTDTGLKPNTRYYYKVIPATQNGAKGKTAGPAAGYTKSNWIQGAWLMSEIGDYRHMFYFDGSSVRYFRVDYGSGTPYIGRDWGTYSVY